MRMITEIARQSQGPNRFAAITMAIWNDRFALTPKPGGGLQGRMQNAEIKLWLGSRARHSNSQKETQGAPALISQAGGAEFEKEQTGLWSAVVSQGPAAARLRLWTRGT